MWNQIWKALTFLTRIQDRIYYLPLLALIAALDLFILLIPTDWLVASSVLIQPKRWWKTALWVGFGSAFGAFWLGYLVLHHRDWVFAHLHLESHHSALWEHFDFEKKVDEHGLWALALLAFSILPQQPGVAIAAMGGMGPFKIFFSVLIGRLSKYLIVAYISSHAPRLLVKWHIIPKKHAAEFENLGRQSEDIQNQES